MLFQLKITTFLLVSLFLFSACKKKDSTAPETPPTTTVNPNLPTLSTLSVSNISDSSAVSGGSVSSEGASVLLAVGVCWDEQPNPSLLKSKTVDGAGIGTYTSVLSSLKPYTTYYLRAYATNLNGTAYSNEISFRTLAKWTLATQGLSSQVTGFASLGTSLFAATKSSGVFVSTNNGSSWNASNSGITNFSTTCIVVTNSVLFVGTQGAGIFCSTTNGSSWVPLNNGLTNLSIRDIVVSGNLLFIINSNDEVYLSADNGSTWTQSNVGAGVQITQLCVSGTRILAFENSTRKIYTSTDNGSNWSLNSSSGPNVNFKRIRKINNRIYLGTYAGAYYSDDEGLSWIRLTAFTNNIVSDFVLSNTSTYGASVGNVLTTENNISWVNVSRGLYQYSTITNLIVHQGILFASTTESPVSGSVYMLPL